ncbi:MAG: hypothetical protein H7331_01300 [Bacteroidia bacterium]|nr:hypothetical protein [Bacteroidia bacterium]
MMKANIIISIFLATCFSDTKAQVLYNFKDTTGVKNINSVKYLYNNFYTNDTTYASHLYYKTINSSSTDIKHEFYDNGLRMSISPQLKNINDFYYISSRDTNKLKLVQKQIAEYNKNIHNVTHSICHKPLDEKGKLNYLILKLAEPMHKGKTYRIDITSFISSHNILNLKTYGLAFIDSVSLNKLDSIDIEKQQDVDIRKIAFFQSKNNFENRTKLFDVTPNQDENYILIGCIKPLSQKIILESFGYKHKKLLGSSVEGVYLNEVNLKKYFELKSYFLRDDLYSIFPYYTISDIKITKIK